MIPQGAAVSFGDIAEELGVASFTTDYLRNNINIRSIFKPMDFDYLEPLRGIPLPSERKMVNYGHTYQAYGSAIQAVREYAHCGETGHFFEWIFPSVWRVLDFWQYDHSRSAWFSAYIQGSSSVPSSTTRINWRMPQWEELVQYIGDMASYSTYQWNFGFLMTKDNLASANEVYWYQFTNIPIATIHEVIDGEGNIPMNIAGVVGVGTWHIIPAWYTSNDIGGQGTFQKVSDKSSIGGRFRMYPFVSTVDLTISSEPSPGMLDNIDCFILSFVVEPVSVIDMIYQITSLSLEFTSESHTAIPEIDYTVTIEGDVWSGTPQVGTGNFSIPALGTVDRTIVDSRDPFVFRLATSEVHLRVRLTRNSEVRNFTFEIPF